MKRTAREAQGQDHGCPDGELWRGRPELLHALHPNGDPSTNSPTDDFAETELGRGDAAESGRATLATHVTISLGAPTSIALRCRRINNSGAPRTAAARESKLIAIKVGSISRTAVSG